jgi:hypothetical protein
VGRQNKHARFLLRKFALDQTGRFLPPLRQDRLIHRDSWDTNTSPPVDGTMCFFLRNVVMTISMYNASAPRFAHVLRNLDAILAKAQAHAVAKKIDPSVLLSARLYPDMFPFTRQVQIACDHAKGAVARLAGVEVPKYEDTEQSFEELQARIAKTIGFMESFAADQIDGSEEREIALKAGGHDMTFKGMPYLLGFALPNFYFHVVTAYDILRHNGVEIGKRDYIGKT